MLESGNNFVKVLVGGVARVRVKDKGESEDGTSTDRGMLTTCSGNREGYAVRRRVVTGFM